MSKVAIIGGGISALSFAYALKDSATITLFEKARGVGGRMSTRYQDPFFFDHGAQFFTHKDPKTSELFAHLQAIKAIAPWQARFVEIHGATVQSSRTWGKDPIHFVGTPHMNGVCKSLANGLHICKQTHIKRMIFKDSWHLFDQNDQAFGPFDWVISTAPPTQTLSLFPDAFVHRKVLAKRTMVGCYALMLGFDSDPDLLWDAACVKQSNISWISANHSKPGRNSKPSFVVHSTNAWAEAHMEQDPDWIRVQLCKTFSTITGIDTNTAEHIDLHRWRYANIRGQQPLPACIDANTKLASCGDWTIKGNVESAMLSGIELATALKEHV